MSDCVISHVPDDLHVRNQGSGLLTEEGSGLLILAIAPRTADRGGTRLVAERPTTLACMHGSAWEGEGDQLLRELGKTVGEPAEALHP
jgi:hypothetical protein